MTAAKVGRGTLIALAISVALAGLGEAALRVAGRARSGVWPETRRAAFYRQADALRAIFRPHAFLNTGPREGARVAAFGKSVELNSLGYRSPERPLARPAGVRRVLLAGGSTTFDILAASNAESWPYRLEGALGGGVEVWNGGFPGWTSLESALALALRDRDLDPDLVVLYQGINDLQPGAHIPFDRQYERGHAALARRALGFELEPPRIFARSLLVQAIADLRGAGDPWAALRAPAAGRRRESLDPAAPSTFARNLRSCVALAQDAGARLILATQPMRQRRDHQDADRRYLEGWYPGLAATAAPAELERLNEVTRAVARQRGLELADLSREVDWSDADFADPMHYTESGREKLVAVLVPRLARALAEIPRSPSTQRE